MSELKAYIGPAPDEKGLADYYLKSEVDAVIAELKNEIEEQKRLRNMALASVPNVLKVMKIIQHQKHKRCLAMARWCENALLGWMGYKESFSSHQRYIKVMLFTKWHKRWRELAEKFKLNSTAQ